MDILFFALEVRFLALECRPDKDLLKIIFLLFKIIFLCFSMLKMNLKNIILIYMCVCECV